jgi:tetratricopeptide (TPR) repeat protein
MQIAKCKLQIWNKRWRKQSRDSRIAAILILQFAFCSLHSLPTLRAQEQQPQPPAQQPPQQQPAQKPAQQPDKLLDRMPFDQIVLKAGNETIDVMLLQLPQRPIAAVPAQGVLKVRLLDRPIEEFEVDLASVAKIRVFEQQLFEEARRLAAAGNFDEAFDYFGRLLREYPTYPGLNEAISDYLRRNALALYQAKQYDRALALLVTLRGRDPSFAGLGGAISTVASDIIEGYLREGKYTAARGVLELWRSKFAGLADEAAAGWQRRFEAAAARQLDEASRFLQAKNYIAARSAVAKARGIWPNLPAATAIADQIEREFPFVTVGVLEQSPQQPINRIDCWPAIRASRLTQMLLAEEIDFGAEGGIYRSPFGEFQPDDSGRGLTLRLNAPPNSIRPANAMSPDALARFLLSTTKPASESFSPDLANQLSGVAIEPGAVQLQFGRVQVLPEARLQIAPPAAAKFVIAEHTADHVIFTAPNSATVGRAGVRAIVERSFANDDEAVAALVAGEIDVLERVPPWQVDRLGGAAGVRVASYRLPTVHVLVPNAAKPLPAKREFRRALCFGIDRKFILNSVLLGGQAKPGFEVISGPFPAGLSLSDPLRYGYNNRVAPRAFEPRLASILATVAWASVQNPSGKTEDAADELPEMPELTLAHPNNVIARTACQTIQMQLARAGIKVKLAEFSTDDLLAGKVDYDLRYAELAVWEPLTDARALLGPGSLTEKFESSFLESGLRVLDEATNWNDVRARLAELHEIASHELPLIPLWQTVNYFAYRESIAGIGESPVALYQNVDAWSSAPASNVARTQPTR